MTATTTHIPGTFCWPELCSADVAASKQFYASLFGWKSSDIHMPAGDYTLLKLGSQRVGAMYQMTEQRKIAGVLPHWNSYVAVISADETARNTIALGGKVLREPSVRTRIAWQTFRILPAQSSASGRSTRNRKRLASTK